MLQSNSKQHKQHKTQWGTHEYGENTVECEEGSRSEVVQNGFLDFSFSAKCGQLMPHVVAGSIHLTNTH